ncbi:MAG: hypothetical protein PVF58_17490 [Candidatus Methanofastidiosia archaeon]|jgi:hypothetical protein
MKKILWVEDEAKDQLLELMGPVWQAGYHVDIAENMASALKKIKKGEYDAYIFDLIINKGDLSGIPEGDFPKNMMYGLELLEEIFGKDSQIKIDPSKCAVFSVIGREDVHEKIRGWGIMNIIVKKEMGRTKLKEIIESIIQEGGSGDDVEQSQNINNSGC